MSSDISGSRAIAWPCPLDSKPAFIKHRCAQYDLAVLSIVFPAGKSAFASTALHSAPYQPESS